jgi:cyclophilin family peptidyl-prolyl cis-trans isomerase/protein-disulfide isomerase
MRKLWFNVLIISVVGGLLLSACSQAKPTTSLTPKPVATEDASAPKMECQVVSLTPTQGPTEVSMFPPPGETDWVHGNNPAATLTIIEYTDFQCPYCAMLAVELTKLVENHPDDVRVVFRHFPLPSHQHSLQASYAAEASGLQGKFWEMANKIFAEQGTWYEMTDAQFQKWLEEQATALGLEKARFIEDMQSETVINKVKAAQQHGIDIKIPGTPLVLVNGQPYQGPRDVKSFESLLGLFQMQSRQYTYCPPMEIDPQKQYTATLKTEKGDIVIQLFPDKAPMAVNSFVFLAREHWFDNMIFHRVVPDFVAQTGDPSGSGYGGPGYYYNDEISDLKYDKEGMVGLATSGPGTGTNGSQFFITYGAEPDLDGKYTIFGQVIKGMDVVKKLTPRDATSQASELPDGDIIQSVEIEEK